jgi:hypothetical protein
LEEPERRVGKGTFGSLPVGLRLKVRDGSILRDPIESDYLGVPQADPKALPMVETETLDDTILMDIGEIPNNTLYLSLAMDVMETQHERFISRTYYPHLFKSQIYKYQELLERRQELIAASRKRLPDDIWKLYETVDLFYDNPKSEIKYENEGIKSFVVVLNTDYVNLLPLDTIFKNIHSTKMVPFIKYNPGYRRDNQYRLYTEQMSRDGTKIPFLPIGEILKISREVGKSNQISLYTTITYGDNHTTQLFIDFQKDGSLRVYATLPVPIAMSELSDVIRDGLKPVIRDINEWLDKHGYKIREFNSLNDDFVVIHDIQYSNTIRIKKMVDFEKYRGCISSVFVIEDADIKSEQGARFRFKRISNYQDMDAVEEMITAEKNKMRELPEIIDTLMREFKLTEPEARKRTVEYFSHFTVADNKVVSQSGFPVSIKFIPSENKLVFSVSNITNLEFVELLKMYYGAMLEPSSEFKKRCVKTIDFAKVDVAPPPPPPPKPTMELDTDFFTRREEEEDEEISGMFDEEEEEEEIPGMFDNEEEVAGGAPELEINVEGTKLKNPNPFQTKMERLVPERILTTNNGEFNQYSRVCSSSHQRQPVILTMEEKNKIDAEHAGSYTTAIQMKDDDKHWYICPRYWSLKHNSSLSKEEVDAILKLNPSAVIPYQAKTVPKGAFIYEFKHPLEHLNEKGEYIPHYPDAIKGKHPDGYEIPCCGKTERKKTVETKKPSNYIVDASKYPIENGRWGLLPLQIQQLLGHDNALCMSKTTPGQIKPNTECLMRRGVSQNILQSFYRCLADICDKDIVDGLTLEIYRTLAVSNTFRTNIPGKDPMRASFDNYKAFLRDPKVLIDHTYLWEIATMPGTIDPSGVNLVILNIVSGNVEMICPEVAFDKDKLSWILIKQEDFYEPVYLYKPNQEKTVRLFSPSALPYLKTIDDLQCRPKQAPNYDFKKPQPPSVLVRNLEKAGYTIMKQVVDFRYQIIGLLVSGNLGEIVVPCIPSPVLDVSIPISYVDDDALWHDYETTRNILQHIGEKVSPHILPKYKIKHKNKIIGFLTGTNQFIKIHPPILDTGMDELPTLKSSDYLEADKIIQTLTPPDQDRIRGVRNIRLESQFYTAFRTTLRKLLESYHGRKNKIDLISILDSVVFDYREKLQRTELLLREIMRDTVVFEDMDETSISNLTEITSCLSDCENKPQCVSKNGKCYLRIPLTNLWNGLANDTVYYTRMADELLRFKRVRNYIMEPKQYLNISNIGYKINPDEILLLDTFVNTAQYKDLNVFNASEYVKILTR